MDVFPSTLLHPEEKQLRRRRKKSLKLRPLKQTPSNGLRAGLRINDQQMLASKTSQASASSSLPRPKITKLSALSISGSKAERVKDSILQVGISGLIDVRIGLREQRIEPMLLFNDFRANLQHSRLKDLSPTVCSLNFFSLQIINSKVELNF